MKLASYRKDIQGLRGFAIFFVLLFHFYPGIIPKGFLGVDLFFVISGYLITAIFFQNQKISIFQFFLKRLYRIAPSIIFVIFFSSLIALCLFLPIDLAKFWYSAISTLLLVPNFYHVVNGGYFGGINELKPMLHMWSLGVEIQFYLFYPILLLLIKKSKNKNYILNIFFILIFSLLLYIFLIIYNYDNLAFFLLPSRLWQFCLGSILFFLPQIKLKYHYRYFIYISSIIFIFYITVTNSEIDNNLRRVLLTFFSCIIIYFGAKITNDVFFLGNFIFQFLGKISYSLYLVHWPVLVFAKYYLVRNILNHELLYLILLVLFLAFLFWFFIENKFRFKIPIINGFKYLSLFITLLIILFFFNISNKYFPERIQQRAITISSSLNSNYRCNFNEYFNFFENRSCKIVGNKNSLSYEVVLLGNSHAQMYGYVFEKFLKDKKLNGAIFSLNACLPTTTLNITVKCLELAKKNLYKIFNNKNVKYVIIGLNWDHHTLKNISNENIDNINGLSLSRSIFDLISTLENRGIDTVLIGPISVPGFEFSSTVSRNLQFGHTQEFVNFVENKFDFNNRYLSVFNFFKEKNYVKIIKPHEVQCKSGNCLFSINNNSLFSDNTHLSRFGSLLMYDIFSLAYDQE